MLIEETLFGTVDKVKVAIARLKLNEPPEGYYVAFSGGKDSCVILDLCKRAGVKYDAHYNLTTVDPPELVYFIRGNYPDVTLERPPTIDGKSATMWNLIVKKRLPPTRMVRYCCGFFKERGGDGRTVVTGVRHEESPRRAKRKMEEICNQHSDKKYLNIIIDWSKEEVWEYIHKFNVPYCELYDEGFDRLGCIMCPLSSVAKIQKEAKRWPKYAAMYRLACKKSFDKAIADGKKLTWSNGDEMYDWWVTQARSVHKDERQCSIFGLMADESIL